MATGHAIDQAAADPVPNAPEIGLSGTLVDSSGGVLLGVTVEAASPALIEKTKSTVTDGNGAYRLVDLRPGIYSLTFSLEGFSTFKRERIELSSDFTMTVTASNRSRVPSREPSRRARM